MLAVDRGRGGKAYACETVLAASWLYCVLCSRMAHFFRGLFGPFGRGFCVTHGERSCRESFGFLFAGGAESLEQ